MKSGEPPLPQETQPGLSWFSSIGVGHVVPEVGRAADEDAVVRVEGTVHRVLRDEVDLRAPRRPVLARLNAVQRRPCLVVGVPVGQRVQGLAVGEVEVVEEGLAPQRGHDAALLRLSLALPGCAPGRSRGSGTCPCSASIIEPGTFSTHSSCAGVGAGLDREQLHRVVGLVARDLPPEARVGAGAGPLVVHRVLRCRGNVGAVGVVAAVLRQAVQVVADAGLRGGVGLLRVVVLLAQADVRVHRGEAGRHEHPAHHQHAHQRERGEALLTAVDQTHCGPSCTSVGSEIRMNTSFSSTVESLSSAIGLRGEGPEGHLDHGHPLEVGGRERRAQQLEVPLGQAGLVAVVLEDRPVHGRRAVLHLLHVGEQRGGGGRAGEAHLRVDRVRDPGDHRLA